MRGGDRAAVDTCSQYQGINWRVKVPTDRRQSPTFNVAIANLLLLHGSDPDAGNPLLAPQADLSKPTPARSRMSECIYHGAHAP